MKRLWVVIFVITALLVVGCSKSYDEYMSIAAEQQEQGQYDEALDAYAKAVRQAADDAAAFTANEKAADLLNYFLKNADSARYYYNAALDHSAVVDADALHQLIKKSLEALAGDVAVKGYTLWLERFADSDNVHEVYYELAEVYHKNIRDLRQAVSSYEYVAVTFPETPQAPKALFSIGYIYANELAEEDNARSYYKRFLDTYPKHEMVPSVEFELKYLGKALEDIPELKHLLTDPS